MNQFLDMQSVFYHLNMHTVWQEIFVDKNFRGFWFFPYDHEISLIFRPLYVVPLCRLSWFIGSVYTLGNN